MPAMRLATVLIASLASCARGFAPVRLGRALPRRAATACQSASVRDDVREGASTFEAIHMGELTLDVADDDTSDSCSLTNAWPVYYDFEAKVVDSNGEPCEGIEVTPSEGCFGPQFSEPKKERNPITKVVLRPYGDKVKFEVKWAKYNPPTYASGVTAGPQRTWNADHPFPSDAYLWISVEGEELAFKINFEDSRMNPAKTWLDSDFDQQIASSFDEQADVEDVWAEVATDEGEIYYQNMATGETSWTRPSTGSTSYEGELGQWTELTTDDGELYYQNTVTGETSWTPGNETPEPQVQANW